MADVQMLRFPTVSPLTAGIAAGATASSPMLLRGFDKASVLVPTGYIGGTATFKAAVTAGAPYRPVYNQSGALVSLPAAKNRVIQLPDAVLVGFYGVKWISTTKQTTTAGAAALNVVAQG